MEFFKRLFKHEHSYKEHTEGLFTIYVCKCGHKLVRNGHKLVEYHK